MRKTAHTTKQTSSGATVISRIIFVACFILIVFIGTANIYTTWKTYESEAKDHALELADSAKAFILPALVKALDADASDLEKPEYQELKNSLIAFKEATDSIHFAYLLTIIDGKLYFLVDSEEPGSEEYSPPGQEYWEASTTETSPYKSPFENGLSLLTDPTTDRWGHWISALVPIFDDETGEVIAVFGTDYSAAEWNNATLFHLLPSIIIVSFMLLLFWTIFWLQKKNSSIKTVSQDLEHSETLFQAVFEQSSIGIAIGQGYRLVSKINPAFEAITGRTKENLTSQDWLAYTHPDDIEEDLKYFGKFQNGEINGYTIEKRFLKIRRFQRLGPHDDQPAAF